MLGLSLRNEFRGKFLKGTLIELTTENKSGAVDIPAESFLEITYPSSDLLRAIEAIGPDKQQVPVLIGERGQGKSHVMAVLHHSLQSPEATKEWLRRWADRLNDARLAKLPLRSGMHVISEGLHRQSYRFLWDLIFDRHPYGAFIRGKWEGQGERKTVVPGFDLMVELFKHTPTALLLDEFQTWYDSLTNSDEAPHKDWAFNFIQILSEVGKEHPNLLVLVASVRNGGGDAYQQLHRISPIPIDFKGPNARRDRSRLLLHRLFENRLQVGESGIRKLIETHVDEYLRLAQVSPSDHDKVRNEFVEAWPFAPHVMALLEDQVLVATSAQETRDLIRILVDLFKTKGDKSPVLTAADFSLEDTQSCITALLDSVSNVHHRTLREKALRNLQAVRDAVKTWQVEVPNLEGLVSALWLRSLAVDKFAGAEPDTLQIDITRDKKIDPNTFEVELSHLLDNGFNIHRIGNRLVFREEENADSRLRAIARNDKLFSDGSDCQQLAKEIRYVLNGGTDVVGRFRVLVLGRNWLTAPWSDIDEKDHPNCWDERIPIVVIPESPDKAAPVLGKWLRDHLNENRNAVRFLIPRTDAGNVFWNRHLLILARSVLKAQEWRQQEPEYVKLHTKYQNELRGQVKELLDRFAVVDRWSFSSPEQSMFHVIPHRSKGGEIPETVHELVRANLFEPEEFEAFVVTAASNNSSVAKLLKELKEPRPGGASTIPWLGEVMVKEKVLSICAEGKIAINTRNREVIQRRPGEQYEHAWSRLKGRLGSGRELEETYLMVPEANPQSDGGLRSSTDESGDPEPAERASAGAGTSESNGSTSSNPFGAGKTESKPMSTRSVPATSSLNLLAKAESWGIGPADEVRDLKLKVGSLTGSQLNKLLRTLPDGITYELELSAEEQ